MARTLPVKWYYGRSMNGNGGSPTLSRTAGSLINVLDACLIDGFNVHAVQSFSIADGVGTINFDTIAHGYVQHQVVAISGAANDDYNGDWRVTGVSGTSITVEATGVANTTVAGALSCKTAPVGGWEKTYSGTNKAVYKSIAIGATGIMLRVDDTNTDYAHVRGYEAMTDIDTGTGVMPTLAQRDNFIWTKYIASTDISFTLVGDAYFFYLVPNHSNVINLSSVVSFGDIVSLYPGDAFHASLTGNASLTASSAYTAAANVARARQSNNIHLARASNQLGGGCGVEFFLR